MASTDPDETFRVTDRRRRAEEDEAARSPSPPRAPVSPPAAADALPAGAGSPPASPSADPDAGERSLIGLFMMLGSSALIALGEAPDPATGQRHRDPAHAADVIDLLALLREKTEERRSPEETQVLDELVYDLQLRYVNVMKRPG